MLASNLGKPDDHIRIIVCMMLQVVIGFVLHMFLRGSLERYLFNIVVGVSLQVYMYRWEVFHIFLMGYATYAIMMIAPRTD